MKWYEDKEYQEMCIEVRELIGKWKRKPGRFFMGEFGDINIVRDIDGNSSMTGLKHDHKLNCIVPLWSQEDLQEIVKPREGQGVFCHIADFCNWLNHHCPIHVYTSPNQLWLAFVMHELYQKKWNPETKKWEKTEK